MAAFQNATSVKNVGAWGVFTRSGHIVTTLGKSQTLSPLGPPFVHPLTWLPPQLPRGVSTALPETLLPTCDRRTTTTTRPSAVAWLAPWSAWPVSLSGILHGLQGLIILAEKSMPRVFGFGAGMAVLLSAANYTGGLKGNKDKEADEFARKEAMRMNRRRPIEETLAEVGEGRCERYTPIHHGSLRFPATGPILTISSHPPSRLRGKETRASQGAVRRRRQDVLRRPQCSARRVMRGRPALALYT